MAGLCAVVPKHADARAGNIARCSRCAGRCGTRRALPHLRRLARMLYTRVSLRYGGRTKTAAHGPHLTTTPNAEPHAPDDGMELRNHHLTAPKRSPLPQTMGASSTPGTQGAHGTHPKRPLPACATYRRIRRGNRVIEGVQITNEYVKRWHKLDVTTCDLSTVIARHCPRMLHLGNDHRAS